MGFQNDSRSPKCLLEQELEGFQLMNFWLTDLLPQSEFSAGSLDFAAAKPSRE
jgi:hypothetical protein